MNAPLRLDASNCMAEVGTRRLHLSPRAFDVLAYLAGRAGQLVHKDELHRAVWRGAIVSDGALVVCIRELRKALDDDARRPRYIETVHRRGYRFIGALTARPASAAAPLAAPLIGREAEMARLSHCWQRAASGERQLVFIAGEAGIGKTALVSAFVATLRDASSPSHQARGQCVDHYGATEAYLPWLEALDRLCRGPAGVIFVPMLNHEAPAWLAQLPALVSDVHHEALLRRAHGTTQGRMLLQLAVALERVSLEHPLLLVLEDLHWSDPSTISALAMLARREERARLMIVGTYRPAELQLHPHPLWAERAELLAHRRCVEITPRPWGQDEVARFLATLGGQAENAASADAGLVEFLNERAGGNPLFVSALVTELRARGSLRQHGEGWRLAEDSAHLLTRVPAEIRSLLQQHGERLEADARRALEAASVAGCEFSAAVVAAALERAPADVERELQRLAEQGQFLQRAGIACWPDGSVTARFTFLHAMHQQAWLERLTPAVLETFHRRIGRHLEIAWGERAAEIAAELAGHFVDGRDLARAVRYLRLAGANAARRSAHREAVQLLQLALDLTRVLPRDVDLDREELELQTILGPVLMTTRGYAAPEVERTYAAARSLCVRVGATPQMFLALYGLWSFYVVRPRHRVAMSIADQLLGIVAAQPNDAWRSTAHWARGASALLMGDLRDSRQHFAASCRAYSAAGAGNLAFEFGQDLGVSSHAFGALAAWHLGHCNQARIDADTAVHIATALGHPLTELFALAMRAWLHLLAEEFELARQQAERGLQRCATLDVPLFAAMCGVFAGAARASLGLAPATAVEQTAGAIEAYRASGGECLCPSFLGIYAECCLRLGLYDAGLAGADEALAMMARNEEHCWAPELLRVRAQLLARMGGGVAQTEALLREAMALATASGAVVPALHAGTDCARCLLDRGEGAAARTLLETALAPFKVDNDFPGARAARELLAGL